MSSWLWIPIAIVIIGIVIAFPLWFTHHRMRHDHDLAMAEDYLQKIGKSADDAAAGRPAPSRQDGASAGYARPRGRHAAPETPQTEGSLRGSRDKANRGAA